MKKLGGVGSQWKIEQIKKILQVNDTDRSIWVGSRIDPKVEIFDIIWHFNVLYFTEVGYFYFYLIK